MNAFQTGLFSGDDEAEPLGDEHYPDNDEYEEVDEADVDEADVDEVDEEQP